MLQRKKEKSIIPSILDSTGNITQNPQEINNVFQKFYNNLYSSDHQPNQSEIDNKQPGLTYTNHRTSKHFRCTPQL